MSVSKEEKELWVRFAVAALQTVESGEVGQEELVDDVAETAAKIADAMMDEYDGRFEKRSRSSRRREEPEEE